MLKMDTYNLLDLLETYAITKEKSIVFIRNQALEKQTDVNIINSVWEYYKEHLPDDIYKAITYSDFNVVEFADDYTAQQFIEDNFPPLNHVQDANYWFHCTAFNSKGEVVFENQPIEKPEETEGA